MKFLCPLCESEGQIEEVNLARPTIRTTCQNCGTILLINPDSGNVEAYKSPFKGTREYALTDTEKPDAEVPVAEMRPTQGSRDWTALITVMVVVIVLISTGIYLILA
jgi:ribosomal protein S27E